MTENTSMPPHPQTIDIGYLRGFTARVAQMRADLEMMRSTMGQWIRPEVAEAMAAVERCIADVESGMSKIEAAERLVEVTASVWVRPSQVVSLEVTGSAGEVDGYATLAINFLPPTKPRTLSFDTETAARAAARAIANARDTQEELDHGG